MYNHLELMMNVQLPIKYYLSLYMYKWLLYSNDFRINMENPIFLHHNTLEVNEAYIILHNECRSIFISFSVPRSVPN